MWKGKHCGRDLVVKVTRTYSNSDLQKIFGVSCRLRSLSMRHVLTTSMHYRGSVGKFDVENPPTSERPPPTGVTMSETQFTMVSNWMANGDINGFAKQHLDANRLQLVGFSSNVSVFGSSLLMIG